MAPGRQFYFKKCKISNIRYYLSKFISIAQHKTASYRAVGGGVGAVNLALLAHAFGPVVHDLARPVVVAPCSASCLWRLNCGNTPGSLVAPRPWPEASRVHGRRASSGAYSKRCPGPNAAVGCLQARRWSVVMKLVVQASGCIALCRPKVSLTIWWIPPLRRGTVEPQGFARADPCEFRASRLSGWSSAGRDASALRPRFTTHPAPA